jgi:hypothetical protein
MKYSFGPKDETDRCAGSANMTTDEKGHVRMGILTSDNRENFILFTPEKARQWASSMLRFADEADTKARKAAVKAA